MKDLAIKLFTDLSINTLETTLLLGEQLNPHTYVFQRVSTTAVRVTHKGTGLKVGIYTLNLSSGELKFFTRRAEVQHMRHTGFFPTYFREFVRIAVVRLGTKLPQTQLFLSSQTNQIPPFSLN